MTAQLRPCPSCARHARVSEASCPFCGELIDESFRSARRPRAPAARLSRAALVALGAAGFTGAGGCASVANLYGGMPCEGDACAPPVATEDAGAADVAVEGESAADAGRMDAPIDVSVDAPVTQGSADAGNYAVPYGLPPH